jgi:hypothetical protein
MTMAEVDQLNLLCDRIEGLAVPSQDSEGSPIHRWKCSRHSNEMGSAAKDQRGSDGLGFPLLKKPI